VSTSFPTQSDKQAKAPEGSSSIENLARRETTISSMLRPELLLIFAAVAQIQPARGEGALKSRRT
jgi:hypothetical protein